MLLQYVVEAYQWYLVHRTPFEVLGLFLAAGSADLGWRRTVLFGGVVWPLAWLGEFSSTRTGIPFGLYHYTGATRGQELYISNVPFMDALSFTFLAYASFSVARAMLAGLRPSRATLRPSGNSSPRRGVHAGASHEIGGGPTCSSGCAQRETVRAASRSSSS